MTEKRSDYLSEINLKNNSLEEKVKGLCEISVQLQEYSRRLRQQSEEINVRLQSCVNLKRAA